MWGASVAWCPRPDGEVWEPDAEPTGAVGQGIHASRSRGHAARLPHTCMHIGAAAAQGTMRGGSALVLGGTRPGPTHSHSLGAGGAVGGVPGRAERCPALRAYQFEVLQPVSPRGLKGTLGTLGLSSERGGGFGNLGWVAGPAPPPPPKAGVFLALWSSDEWMMCRSTELLVFPPPIRPPLCRCLHLQAHNESML